MITYLKTLILLVIACFFTLIVYNNIFDYETNRWGVETVLKMDQIDIPNVKTRAIQSEAVIALAYHLIIVTEAVIAVLCWTSAFLFGFKRKGLQLGLAGLSLAFTLFMLGFVVIANEWFYLWRHPILTGLPQKASILSLLMLCSILILLCKEKEV